MKSLTFLIVAVLLTVSMMSAPAQNGVTGTDAEPVDSVAVITDAPDSMVAPVTTAREAFLRFPAPTLDLLTTVMRNDLLTYYDADTLRKVPNAMEGLSSLVRPLNDSYLSCQITPVSTLTLKVLPAGKKRIVAAVYTISNSGHAADSELSFYDDMMRPVKTKKHIHLADIEDFIRVPKGHEGAQLKHELIGLIPYPMVEYRLNPDDNTLTARLTVESYLGSETMLRLKPYIIPELKYAWTGKQFRKLN